MIRILIRSFSRWETAKYEVHVEGNGYGNAGGTTERFLTKRAAYLFAEEQVRAGRNAQVYKWEEQA